MAHGGTTWILGIASLLALAGCGGGDSVPPDEAMASDPGPQGYYAGFWISDVTDSADPAVALIADDGAVRIVDILTGRQFVTSLHESDSTWQATLSGYAGPLARFPDQASRCSGDVRGGAFAAVELVGSYSCGGDHGSFDLVFSEPVSFDPPDVGELTGLAESDSAAGNIILLHIAPDGSFTGSDTEGCSYTGRFETADPIIDIFTMQLRLSCAGHAWELTGLASLVQNDRTAQLYYGASDKYHSRAGVLLFQ